mmetsp:Transcript_19545/g.27870  ORF Transcript_19545/g.27870 Transcript_19545/m.27870 type:complete len:130 (+) Transcript_19545:681-1070(+)
MSVSDLQLVQQNYSKVIRNSLHLNKSFPDALFYGSKKYGGLGIIPLVVQQCFLKLSLFLHHIRSADDIGKQLLITIASTQLEIGMPTQFFQLPYQKFAHLLTKTWTTYLWEFLSLSNTTLHHSDKEQVW